jgi:hypothetical protein
VRDGMASKALREGSDVDSPGPLVGWLGWDRIRPQSGGKKGVGFIPFYAIKVRLSKKGGATDPPLSSFVFFGGQSPS